MALKELRRNFAEPVTRLWTRVVPWAWLRETIETVVWAVALAALLKMFVVGNFWIPSESMVPTLLVGDRVIVWKFEYLLRKPRRGDVIVFKYPRDPKVDYVKRLIGLPGDSVEIKNGVVFVNGEQLAEPYVTFHDVSNYKATVPEGAFLALGDNRPNSLDGRFWGFVPAENVYGPVSFRYWPLKRIGLVR